MGRKVIHCMTVIEICPRNPEPRNWKGFGNRSIEDMMFNLGKYLPLNEDEFKAELAARKAKGGKATN